MSFATGREFAPAHPFIQRTLSLMLVSGLLLAAGTHLAVAVDHGPSVFAALSLTAAIAQCVLGVAVLLRPSPFVYQSSIFLSLTLMQLYALNVVVGLPPIIAHTHLEGTHALFGITLALPNRVDAQGIVAQCAQLATVFSGAFLDDPD
jgi:hypothetical protein